MRREEFLERFRTLEAQGRLTDKDIEDTCASIAALAEPSRNAIHALCDIATLPDERRRLYGQRAIFTEIVERLSDSFEPADVAAYDRLFAQIIEDCRRRPPGRDLDRTLGRFGLHGEQDLLDRKQRIARARRFAVEQRDPARVQRIFMLSRVTLGADVAVTSIIMNGLAMTFPNAAITLVGPPPIGELYETPGPFHTRDAPYARHGSLMDRLNNWIELVDILDRERKNLAPSEYLVVDPDSRLTQLGLLPVVEEEDCYFFFESRALQRPGKRRLGELAAAWQLETFGGVETPQPFVWLTPRNLMLGQRAHGWLRDHGAAGVVAFNFGVGGNAEKRLPLEFENRLVQETLKRGYSVILDTGIGAERERAAQIVAEWRAAGRRVVELNSSNALSDEIAPRPDEPVETLTWQGGPGGFAGLMGSADLYVGYDSAFQHIAAALGRPTIDMFVRQNNDRFVERWTPSGAAGETASQVARLDPAAPLESALGEILSHIPQSPYRRQSRL
jgi:ADP-heptose:LPS heptosyltransferase